MMNEDMTAAYMGTYLEQSYAQASRLLQLLTNEREAISKSDADALEGITAEKKHIARQLENATQACMALLKQSDFSSDDKGMLDFFASCEEPHAVQLSEQWNTLQGVLKQCKEENRINGQLLESSQRRIKQAIGILQGQPTDQELYGRKGKTLATSLTNSLTQA